MYLKQIDGPADLKGLGAEGRRVLAQEVRDALLAKASAHGGHFGPNFGFVETTIALHTVFDSPRDHLVFDVSHQTYTHKMLTGRKEAFLSSEHYDDVSAYSNPDETDHDLFKVGHTSTSVSLALGLAKARDVLGGSENVVAIIGDGSLSGGEALEGLNAAAELDSNFIVVVNDNQMSIAENHGGLYGGLAELRRTRGEARDNLFRAMGFDYRYVADGNDCEALIPVLEEVHGIRHPVVVHVNTFKGKGYAPAEADKEAWHWHMPFDIETGESHPSSRESYAALAGEYLLERSQSDESLLVVASGVTSALDMNPRRRRALGAHYVDVGIAEEAAVALASGAAKRGANVVWGTAATFIQRSYDQLSQDLAINGNPATIVGANGSVWGMSDVTHAAFYSIPLIANIPDIVYLAPTNAEEYLSMLAWSLDQREHPVYIAVPGGPVTRASRPVRSDFSQTDRYEVVRRGSRVAVLALGDFFALGEELADGLAEELGIRATLVNPQFASGLDRALLDELAKDHELVVTLEDGSLDGGFGGRIARHLGATRTRVACFGFERAFYDRYDAAELMREAHLTPDQLCRDVRELLA